MSGFAGWIGGGESNSVPIGTGAAVAGGSTNTATANDSIVAGGQYNIAGDPLSFVGAGCENLTGSGTVSTKPCTSPGGEAILGGSNVQLFGTDDTFPG